MFSVREERNDTGYKNAKASSFRISSALAGIRENFTKRNSSALRPVFARIPIAGEFQEVWDSAIGRGPCLCNCRYEAIRFVKAKDVEAIVPQNPHPS
jgi:hypothetical protein